MCDIFYAVNNEICNVLYFNYPASHLFDFDLKNRFFFLLIKVRKIMEKIMQGN